jgi:hypothetical protein
MINFDNNGDLLVFSLEFVNAASSDNMKEKVSTWAENLSEETNHHLGIVYCGAITAYEVPVELVSTLLEAIMELNGVIKKKYGASEASESGERFLISALDGNPDSFAAAKKIENESPLQDFRTGLAIGYAMKLGGSPDTSFLDALGRAAMDQRNFIILDDVSFLHYKEALIAAETVLN